MDSGLEECRIACPFCGEGLTVLVDLSAGTQHYVEDCQICCQPMEMAVDVDENGLLSVRAERGQ